MSNRTGLCALAIAACAWLQMAGAADRATPQYEMEIAGKIVIAADGHVSDFTLEGENGPAVASLVEGNVRSWTFEPILVDGRAVKASTRMRLALAARPVDAKGYELKVANVWFGEPGSGGQKTPPKYPLDALQAGVGAKVLLVLKVDAQGRVVDVLTEQTSLDKRTRQERVAEQWRRVFERASVAAAKTWTFEPGESVGGQPTATLVRVPIAFHVTDRRGESPDGQWQAYVPGPVNPIPWVDRASVADQSDRDRLTDGDAQSLSSRFKLKDDVIGRIL